MSAEARFTAWDLTAWAALIHSEFVETVGRLPSMTIVRDLNDANAKTIPVLEAQTSAEVTALTDRLAADATVQNNLSLTHQNSLEVSDLISWEAEIQVPWSIVEERTKRMVQDVAHGYLERFIRAVVGFTPTASPDHAIANDDFLTTDTVANNAAAARDAIIKTNELFNIQIMPQGPENRTIILADHLFNALFTLGEVVRKDFGNVGGVRTFGSGEYTYGDFTLIRASTAWATNHAFPTATPSKYKIDLSNSPATADKVYAIAFVRQGLAQGFTRMAPSPVVIERPVWVPWRKGWFMNVAMIWDIIKVFIDESTDRNVGVAFWHTLT